MPYIVSSVDNAAYIVASYAYFTDLESIQNDLECTDPPLIVMVFDTPQAANGFKRTLSEPKSYAVTFLPTQAESNDWRRREAGRFETAEYIHPPWHAAGYRSPYPLHYAHLSVADPSQIAFTKSPEHGVKNIQTRMRPGRYFEAYPEFRLTFGEKALAEWVAACAALSSELKFASTADDIEQAYLVGPPSCMAHPLDEFESDCHPVRVYGGSDLQLAYIGNLAERVIARCLVWPAKKVYGRPYGYEAAIKILLDKAGYGPYNRARGKSFSGARLTAIKHDSRGRYILPYIDWHNTVSLSRDKEWLVIDGDGYPTFNAQPTEGIAYEEDRDDEDSEPEYDYTCERCNDGYNEGHGDGTYCNPCIRNASICPACEELRWDDFGAPYADSPNNDQGEDAENVCEACLEHHHTRTCIIDGCGRQWVEEFRYTDREHASRVERHMANVCQNHIHDYRWCDHCEALVSVEPAACAACERNGRCESTADLLAPVVEGTDHV